MQAAFLVLVCRPGSIKRKESVGSWLYGVARNIALKARAQDAARRKRDRAAATMRAEQPNDPLAAQELRSILDEAYRNPGGKVPCDRSCSATWNAKATNRPPANSAARKARSKAASPRPSNCFDAKWSGAASPWAAQPCLSVLAETAKAAPLPAALTIKTVKAAALVVAGKAVVGGVFLRTFWSWRNRRRGGCFG